MSEKKELKTKRLMCDIDTIVANKLKKLSGHGLQKAIATLEEIYRLKELKASEIEIFDKIAKLCWMLEEHTSKIKGKQQQLLGL